MTYSRGFIDRRPSRLMQLFVDGVSICDTRLLARSGAQYFVSWIPPMKPGHYYANPAQAIRVQGIAAGVGPSAIPLTGVLATIELRVADISIVRDKAPEPTLAAPLLLDETKKACDIGFLLYIPGPPPPPILDREVVDHAASQVWHYRDAAGIDLVRQRFAPEAKKPKGAQAARPRLPARGRAAAATAAGDASGSTGSSAPGGLSVRGRKRRAEGPPPGPGAATASVFDFTEESDEEAAGGAGVGRRKRTGAESRPAASESAGARAEFKVPSHVAIVIRPPPIIPLCSSYRHHGER